MSAAMIPYPFPSISWWKIALAEKIIVLNTAAHYNKSNHTNRYDIGAANGLLRLSIPLVGGRQQRKLISEIKISYDEDWQRNHLRSLESAYARTPFFEHYAPSIEPLFQQKFEPLIDFNIAGIELIIKLLKADVKLEVTDEKTPLQDTWSPKDSAKITTKYQQPFIEKNGFLPELSILDLLFSEGPNTLNYLS